MAKELIEVKPISGALGAEIGGVNLSEPLGDDVVAAIRSAFLDHLVIFFRGQDLTPARQIAFSKRFGTLDTHEFVAGMADFPEIIAIKKEAPSIC